MANAHVGFVAYPALPRSIPEAIAEAVELSNSTRLKLEPWEKLPIIGLKIDNLIRERISGASVLIADITFSNFNVYYEIGYALAQDKPVVPLVNLSFKDAKQHAQLTGIFDTTGWLTYENSRSLIKQLEDWNAISSFGKLKKEKNHSQPLFILDTIIKSNDRGHIFSSVSNSEVNYRSFDPSENPRLTASHAIAEVSSSAGVIVTLLKDDIVGAHENNLRAAFIAGLAHGFGVDPLIIQFDNGPAALDFRDFVTNSNRRVETERHVTEYCQQVLIENQRSSGRSRRSALGLLNKIDLGASAAESEGQQLADYFVSTAEYARALRSQGSLIVGRKGSGKSAIAIRATSEFSRDVRSLILDLKPAAHNLSDLREQLLGSVGQGLFDHTVAAFWHYVVMLEILLAIRERIIVPAKRDFRVQEQLVRIETEFGLNDEFVSGDFTLRLDYTVSQVLDALKNSPPADEVRERITNDMYERVIPVLRERILELSSYFENIVVVFDDLDKNWPPRRLENYDVRMIRHLIEILKRLRRDLSRKEIDFQYLVCLRSDVYDVLVEETADRGKDNLISVDWSDREQLIHLIRERVSSSFDDRQADEAWEAFNAPMPDGRRAIEHLIDTSLFRPRFLIEVCERVLSAAVNRGHSFVDESDVEHAMKQMSLYLVSDFANEMRNIAGTPEDIFYAFIGSGDLLTHDEVASRIAKKLPDMDHEFVIDLLVWYGFLGIIGECERPVFIYDRAYDFKRLLAERPNVVADRLYAVNAAFTRGLNQR